LPLDGQAIDGQRHLIMANHAADAAAVWFDWSIGAVGVDITSGQPPSMPPASALPGGEIAD
jgi:hypothetical protein